MKLAMSCFLRRAVRFLFDPKTVGDVLERSGNNFDLLRFVAASFVILGHAFALAPAPGMQDPLLGCIHFDYTGGLAVTVFFFLSGMLVCDSYKRSENLPVFLSARLARVLPALCCSLLLCIYVVGPVFTTLSSVEYLKSREVYSYFTRNALLTDLQWRLPGVFDSSRFGLNGAMWSLPLEVRLYIALGFVGVLGALKGPIRTSLMIAVVLAVGFFQSSWIPYFLDNADFLKPSLSFVLGVWVASNKRCLRVNLFGVLLLVGACAAFWHTKYQQLLFYPTVYWFCLWFFSTHFARRLRLSGDYSYGIYIYGFIVQQCVAALVFRQAPYGNFMVSLAVSTALAAFSWHYVELPVLEYWRSFVSRVRKSPGDFLSNLFRARRIVFSVLLVGVFLAPVFGLLAFEVTGTEFDRLSTSIVNYGPPSTEVGRKFNVQPSGYSVLIVTVDKPLTGEAEIIMGGVRLKGLVQGLNIIGEVPERFFSSPRSVPICVQDRNAAGRLARTDSVLFTAH